MAQKKLRKLTITGFRGIRHTLSIDFTRKFNSVLIYGANAKGKSSIGDAFEWFYTGEVKELTKEGCTREDYRHRLLDDAEDAVVGLELSEADLNSEIRLRSTRRQNRTNNSDEYSEYLRISKDELLILRHKDLKQFVDETKGEKRKQIAQLIGMDGWEKIRNDMGTVENRLVTSLDQKKKAIEERQNEVAELIGADYSLDQCWAFGKEQAKNIGLEIEISNLEDLRDADEKAKASTEGSARAKKLAQLNSAEGVLKSPDEKPPVLTEMENFETQYNSISADAHKVLCVQLNNLYTQGKSLLEDGKWGNDSCPLCGAEISQSDLLSHIEKHQGTIQGVVSDISEFEKTRKKAKDELKIISGLVNQINGLKLEDVEKGEQLKAEGETVRKVV